MSSSSFELFVIVVLVIVVAAMVAQLFVMLMLFFGFAKVAKGLKEEIADIHSSVMPIIFDLRKLVGKTSPKLESAVGDVAYFTQSLRNQAHELEQTSSEVAERVRRLSARVDDMSSRLLNTVDQAGATVSETVSKPLRQFAGVVASAKAIVDSFRNSTAAQGPPRPRGGSDMFV
jgi:methyl-accepting chemotaxis protein